MNSEISRSKVYQVEVMNAASQATDAVRLQEFEAGLSGTSPLGHTHAAGSLTDYATAWRNEFSAYITDGDLVYWVEETVEEVTTRRASVKLDPNGGLVSGTGNGLAVRFGSGEQDVAPGNHTHAQLHDAVSVVSGTTVAFSLSGQQLGAEVRYPAGKHFKSGEHGLELEYATDANHPARGDHGHAQLHDALTVGNTSTVDLLLSGTQHLTAAVRVDATPAEGKGLLQVGAGGLSMPLGTGEGQAAEGNHTHGNATSSAPGFMSVEDKLKLDLYTQVLQTDQCVTLFRPDVCPEGEYVGGRRRWGQAMQIMEIQLAATPPVGVECLLGLEVNNVIVEHITVPASGGIEVLNQKTLSNIHVTANHWVRVKMVSGTGAIEDAPAKLDVVLQVRPSIASIASLKINAGGNASSPFIADAYFGAGGSVQTSANPIDTSAVSDPAPQAVYQSARVKYNDANTFSYTVTGLARGISYLARLHFAELNWTAVGKQKMKVEVVGKTTGTLNDFDIFSEAGGVQFKAVVKEFTVEPTNDGGLEVRFTPLASVDGQYHLSVNGVELVPVVD